MNISTLTSAERQESWLLRLPSDLLQRTIAAIREADTLMRLASGSPTLLEEVSSHVREELRSVGDFKDHWVQESLGRQLCRLHRLRVWGAARVLLVGPRSYNVSLNEFARAVSDGLVPKPDGRPAFKATGGLIMSKSDGKVCASVASLGDDDTWNMVVVAADQIPERNLRWFAENSGFCSEQEEIMLTGWPVPIDTLQTLTSWCADTNLAFWHQPSLPRRYRVTAMTTLRHNDLCRIGTGPRENDEPRTVFKLYDGAVLAGVCRMHYTNPDHEYTDRGGPTLRKFKAQDASCRMALFQAIKCFVNDLTGAEAYHGRIQLHHGVMAAHPRFWKALRFVDTTGEGDFSFRLHEDMDSSDDSEDVGSNGEESAGEDDEEATAEGAVPVHDSDGDSDDGSFDGASDDE